ncbi:hypothetical protein PMAYCL1PPCAC_10269, partial [Pristionchus mayeri]
DADKHFHITKYKDLRKKSKTNTANSQESVRHVRPDDLIPAVLISELRTTIQRYSPKELSIIYLPASKDNFRACECCSENYS